MRKYKGRKTPGKICSFENRLIDTVSPADQKNQVTGTFIGSSHADEMEVSVREGRVMIANAAGTSSGVAGERIRVTPRGEIVRSTVPAHDASWRWAAPRLRCSTSTSILLQRSPSGSRARPAAKSCIRRKRPRPPRLGHIARLDCGPRSGYRAGRRAFHHAVAAL